jgi:hypothetical protein
MVERVGQVVERVEGLVGRGGSGGPSGRKRKQGAAVVGGGEGTGVVPYGPEEDGDGGGK